MSRIHILRHASTAYSRAYRVNGDPDRGVPLDAEGRADCGGLATGSNRHWIDRVETCVVSRFPRTAETAELVLGARTVRTIVDARLDEVDYGEFENGPWQVYGDWLTAHGRWAAPFGGRESLHDAQLRALSGLRAVLTFPGPRLVVTHGFLVSLIRSLRDSGRIGGLVLPGCPPLTVLSFSDDEAAELLDLGMRDLERQRAAAFDASVVLTVTEPVRDEAGDDRIGEHPLGGAVDHDDLIGLGR